LYAFDAIAVDGFSDIAQHTGPGNPKPNLSTAVTDSAHDVATAYVAIGNAMIKADYAASTRGVDAVSAVLMADALYNEFNSDPTLGAQTDFLVTFPTKQFYVDPGIVGTAIDNYQAPFEEVFGGGYAAGKTTPADAGNSCDAVSAKFVNRDAAKPPSNLLCGTPPRGNSNFVCSESQALRVGAHHSAPGALSSRGTYDLEDDSTCAARVAVPFDTGTVALGLAAYGLQMRPSSDGKVFPGLPALGFAAINYINANVTPGVLSNYSAAYPHRSSASCTNSTNPQGGCQ